MLEIPLMAPEIELEMREERGDNEFVNPVGTASRERQ